MSTKDDDDALFAVADIGAETYAKMHEIIFQSIPKGLSEQYKRMFHMGFFSEAVKMLAKSIGTEDARAMLVEMDKLAEYWFTKEQTK